MMASKEHDELVAKSARWLHAHGNPVVVTELASGAGEEADAIGFNGWQSTLIECKVSRADFLADAKKPWRRDPERGLGDLRYFCCPKGLVDVKELPEYWGLLETSGTGLRIKQKAPASPKRNYRPELCILISVIRRIGQSAPSGISIKCYTINTGNRATLGIDLDAEDAPEMLAIQSVSNKEGQRVS